MGLNNGKNHAAQFLCCYDLQKADREFVLKKTAIGNVLYSI